MTTIAQRFLPRLARAEIQMGRKAKQTPLDAFADSLDDAEALVTYARAFENQRVRRMRKELRNSVGDALNISIKRRDSMDCIENDDVIIVFRNQGVLGRDRFKDPRPLLRQAIVAGCAALETMVADIVIEHIGGALDADEKPKRLRDISLTVGHWFDIETKYERRRWGIRGIVEDEVRKQASTAPSKIGEVLGIIGITKWDKKVDHYRNKSYETTKPELEAITERRNRIAHAADRAGQGRAKLEIEEVNSILIQIREIAEGIDQVTRQECS